MPLRRLTFALLGFLACDACAAGGLAVHLLPSPRIAEEATGAPQLIADFRAEPDAPGLPEATPALRLLRENFRSGPAIPVRLRLAADAGIPPEGYRLALSPREISATAADTAGLFYAVQTLRQLAALHPSGIPAGRIEDAPAFPLRGFMDDTGRNFRTVAELKARLDLLAAYKLNTFHWHLTDHPAWRIRCKAYPQLNDPTFRRPGRDTGSTYSYDDIREVIRYARERHIRVIPELDMPGHSAYFEKAFGFGMGDPRAMPVLKKLIAEFCEEIPREDRPRLHLGSDEVRIADGPAFVAQLAGEVLRHGSVPVIWNPGLRNDGRCVEQRWKDQGSSDLSDAPAAGVIDSAKGYLNALDPQLAVRRYFFTRTCDRAEGDPRHLGAILCCWPDVRVDDKRRIDAQNGVRPALIAFAENTWRGRPEFPKSYADRLPPRGTPAFAEYAAFETAVIAHRDLFFPESPFPFVRETHLAWTLAGPYLPDKDGAAPAPSTEEILGTPETSPRLGPLRREVTGGVILPPGELRSSAPGACVYATTFVKCDRARDMLVQIGFEAPTRSNRQSGGIPPAGRWSPFDAEVLVNGVPAPAPAWENAGRFRFPKPTWHTPAEEIPFTDEEFYWTRCPSRIRLRAGTNQILLKIPCQSFAWPWRFAFLPVRTEASGRLVADDSATFSARPD